MKKESKPGVSGPHANLDLQIINEHIIKPLNAEMNRHADSQKKLGRQILNQLQDVQDFIEIIACEIARRGEGEPECPEKS